MRVRIPTGARVCKPPAPNRATARPRSRGSLRAAYRKPRTPAERKRAAHARGLVKAVKSRESS